MQILSIILDRGQYFLTVVTQNREQLFGEVINGKMILSEYGKIVADEIQKIPEYHKRVILNEWVVMPDHIHLLLNWVVGISPTDDEIKKYRIARRKMIIFKIIGKLQMLTSKQINILRNTTGARNLQNDHKNHHHSQNPLSHNKKQHKSDKNIVLLSYCVVVPPRIELGSTV